LTTPRSLRLGFAGTPGFAVPALDALSRSAHQILAVFTKVDGVAGRGRRPQPSEVKVRALELGLPIHQPATFKSEESSRLLRDLKLDALIVVAYGLILPAAALEATRLGCFNIHASLLPRWRGAAPIQRAILAGDERTGVTIMRMQEGLDTGPMLASRAVAILPSDTAGSLAERLAQLGASLITETTDALARSSVTEVAQPDGGVTYAAKISKAEALIDWREDASSIVRRIRAFNPAPVAETRWNGTQLRLFEARVLEEEARLPNEVRARGTGALPEPGSVLGASPDGIEVACGAGAVRISRLQLAGRKPMPASEFIKAQRLTGARFASS
jgi:methionyl-tRNA formyltransferase